MCACSFGNGNTHRTSGTLKAVLQLQSAAARPDTLIAAFLLALVALELAPAFCVCHVSIESRPAKANGHGHTTTHTKMATLCTRAWARALQLGLAVVLIVALAPSADGRPEYFHCQWAIGDV